MTVLVLKGQGTVPVVQLRERLDRGALCTLLWAAEMDVLDGQLRAAPVIALFVLPLAGGQLAVNHDLLALVPILGDSLRCAAPRYAG